MYISKMEQFATPHIKDIHRLAIFNTIKSFQCKLYNIGKVGENWNKTNNIDELKDGMVLGLCIMNQVLILSEINTEYGYLRAYQAIKGEIEDIIETLNTNKHSPYGKCVIPGLKFTLSSLTNHTKYLFLNQKK